MTAGASSSRKASAMWGATLNAHVPSGKVSQGLTRIRVSRPGLAPEEDVALPQKRISKR